MKKNVRRGFTLPEVLVTVTVVAVLAAVVVPAVTQYVNRGNAPATQTDFTQVQTAIMGYIADTRQAPAYLDQLAAASSSVSGYHGPYLSLTLTSATGQTAALNTAAFTSGGLGISVSDSIDANSADGYYELFVVSPTSCANLLLLDSTYDNKDGAGTGKVTWSGACASGNNTGAYSAAKFKLVAKGA